MNRYACFVKAVLKPFVWCLMPFTSKGKENIPEGAVMLCSNHASNWDPVLLYLDLCNKRSELAVMAKKELMSVPLLGDFLRHLGVFGVNRGNADLGAVKTTLRCLKENKRVLIFPEGTRVYRAGKVKAKGGAVMMAVRAGVPVVPVYVGGQKRLLRPVWIYYGEPYYPAEAGRKLSPTETQELTDELMERIYSLPHGGKTC